MDEGQFSIDKRTGNDNALAWWGHSGGGFAAGPQLLLNRWTHVAATYDGDMVRLYQDGLQVGINTQPVSFVAGKSVCVGAYKGSTGNSCSKGTWLGKIDEVRLYDRVLTGAEVAELGEVDPPNPGDLIGYWKFDEPVGSQAAIDSSGRGHVGHIEGDPAFVPGGGKLGGALELDGVDDAVHVRPSIDIDTISSLEDVTIAAWVFPTAHSSSG